VATWERECQASLRRSEQRRATAPRIATPRDYALGLLIALAIVAAAALAAAWAGVTPLW
jgi:hypothetical protein